MNLLFLYTDEQAFNTLAAYGNMLIDMPNLNRLAERSTIFNQAYVTQPVCTPSRSTLLTGLTPHTNGCTANNIPLDKDTLCLPEMLNGNYQTGHIGKWHLGDEVFKQHGFDTWVSIEDVYRSHYSEGRDTSVMSSYHNWLISKGFTPEDGDVFRRGETARYEEAFSKPVFLAEETIQFIEKNQKDPFVLYVNFLEPHMPFFGPRDNQYNPDEIPLPDNFNDWPDEDNPLKTQLLAEVYKQNGHSGLPLRTEEEWRRLIANYWGLCSLIDTYIGKILDSLDECGLTDDTLIVFTSDHGDMMGSHRLVAKCVMYQEAVRVPMMIACPGQKEQKRINGPVSQLDMVPTLLDLMGEQIPDNLEGVSRRQLVENGGECRDDVIIEWNGPNSGVGKGTIQGLSEDVIHAAVTDPVRTIITADGWRYSYSPAGQHELYNLNTDPGETENLAADDAQAGLIDDLQKRIKAWQERTGDTVVIGG